MGGSRRSSIFVDFSLVLVGAKARGLASKIEDGRDGPEGALPGGTGL